MTHEEETTPDVLDNDDAASPPSLDAAHVIEQFGGIRPMAAKIGVAVTTVQGWKNRGTIPANRREAIAAAAAEQGIELDETAAVRASDTDEGAEFEIAEPEIYAATGPASEEQPAHTGAGLIGVSLAMSLVAILVAVAVATQPHWAQWGFGQYIPALTANGGAVSNNAVANNAAAEREAAARIDALTTRLAALEAEMAAPTASPPDPELRQRIAALEVSDGDSGDLQSALATVRDRVASVEKSLGAAQAEQARLGEELAALSTTASGALQAAVTVTQDRMKTIEASLDAALTERAGIKEQLTAAVDAMNSRAGALSTDLDAIRKAQHNESEGRKVTVGLALSGLEAVLVTDRPFRLALTALRDVATGQSVMDAGLTENLARIEPFAASGAPTLTQLIRQYRDLAPELARRDSLGGREDWVGQTLDKIYDVVSWRRVGGPIDQAAEALAVRDLKGAVSLLSAQPEFEPVARNWLAGARNRIAVTAALDAVRASITKSQARPAQKSGPAQ